jgi:steroid delta-isomerase-like uncharacterized protein
MQAKVVRVGALGNCDARTSNNLLIALSPPAGTDLRVGDVLALEAFELDRDLTVTNITSNSRFAVHIAANNVHDLDLPMAHGSSRTPTDDRLHSQVTIENLDAFADAFNRHDADAIMSFMTEDCVFESSAGPDVCGTRYVGQAAVRGGFEEVFAAFPDAQWGQARHFIDGDRGVSEWTFTGTRSDGTRVEVHGCDLFTFREGKIALKNSYRKNRLPRT